MKILGLTVISALYYLGLSFALHPVTTPAQLEYDPNEYYTISSQQLHGDFVFNARRTPFYPLLLSLMRLLTGDHIVGTQLVGAFFFSLSAPLAYILVRKILRNDAIALTVAALVIIWPPYALFAGMLYSESAALPFFLAFLILLPRGSLLTAGTRPPILMSAIAGAALALCVLLRPMYIFFVPFALLVLFLEEPNRKIAFRNCMMLTGGCLALIFPWSLYSSLRAGTPIMISANGGETLAGGIGPRMMTFGKESHMLKLRNAWNGPGKWVGPEKSGYLSPSEEKLPYVQRDALLRSRATHWIMANPQTALLIERAKIFYMWGLWPFSLHDRQTLYGSIPVLAFLTLSITALVRFSTSLRQLSRFWALPLFSTVVALFSWGSWRFRQPADIGILTLGALCVWSFVRHRGRLVVARETSLRERTVLPAQ